PQLPWDVEEERVAQRGSRAVIEPDQGLPVAVARAGSSGIEPGRVVARGAQRRDSGTESRRGPAEPKAPPRALPAPGEHGAASLARTGEGHASVDVGFDTGIEEDDSSRADGACRARSHGGIAREADARDRGKLERPERVAELGKGRRLLERHG